MPVLPGDGGRFGHGRGGDGCRRLSKKGCVVWEVIAHDALGSLPRLQQAAQSYRALRMSVWASVVAGEASDERALMWNRKGDASWLTRRARQEVKG